MAPVSTGSATPKRGSVARNARNRKIASIMSPRACLIDKRGEFGIVQRALRHHPIDRELELPGNLLERQFGY